MRFRNIFRFSVAKSFYEYPVLDEKINIEEDRLKENFKNMAGANNRLVKELERVQEVAPKDEDKLAKRGKLSVRARI